MTGEFVVGFSFDRFGRSVVLVRKNRPAWQAGTLNGPGGRVEPGEAPVAAMVREFNEETGGHSTEADWRIVAVIEAPTVRVCFFASFNGEVHRSARPISCEPPRIATDEPVMFLEAEDLRDSAGLYGLGRHVAFLIELCLGAGNTASGTRLVLPVVLREEAVR